MTTDGTHGTGTTAGTGGPPGAPATHDNGTPPGAPRAREHGTPPGARDTWSTHAVLLGRTRVTKRHRGEDAGRRAAAEWRALDALHRYAPGLAPEPLSPRPAPDRPEIVMSRLDGEPLRGAPIDGPRLHALAAAVHRVHTAVPAAVLARWPPRDGGPHQLAEQIRWLAPHARARTAVAAPDVAAAVDEGLAWLAAAEPLPDADDRARVLGHGDGNLANYLWDGTRVAVVDFEFAGASERSLELAEITEHIAAWTGPPLDPAAFLGHFDLGPAESVRLRILRRLLALHWLCRLALEDPAAARNPPGTAERQAARLRGLLGEA